MFLYTKLYLQRPVLFCVEFACSLCVYMFSPGSLSFLLLFKNMQVRYIGDTNLSLSVVQTSVVKHLMCLSCNQYLYITRFVGMLAEYFTSTPWRYTILYYNTIHLNY